MSINQIQKLVYEPCGFQYSQPVLEPESQEYGACFFKLGSLSVRFRIAKITPTKIGQFVTLWKRLETGPTAPYDLADSVDYFVISARSGDHFGQFVFSKAVLLKQGIFSKDNEGGKRGIRVYPPWDKTTSRQAQKTQEWQLQYFLETPESKPVDLARAKMLYGLA
ncbi:MAG: MepB family protein [Myxococcaceae bacterium]